MNFTIIVRLILMAFCFTSFSGVAKGNLETSGDALHIALPAAALAAALTVEDDYHGTWHLGHTADSFAAATFINQRYGWEYGVPSYIAASYVAYTRVASDKHHIEDVLAGAAIGMLAGWYFTDPYEDISIIPLANNGTYGVLISGRF